MNYLLDTCVLSEFTRRKPEEKILQWVASIDEERLFLSAVTIGEIQRGIERLPDSNRKTELQVWWNNGLLDRFHDRVLPLDAQTMLLWGSLTARMENNGQPMSVMDALIAATAFQHNLIVVTRNQSDFLLCGVQLINPWIQ
ncbi:MAG: VapC toxin family PIN domain ribonuclease [Chloroflexi bacterium HGW-Chloroflexi-10]|nr:MAG: VapC toxin family PIN domain ribonuclease [Chloroflexi bacterium HGW-Chloroflexi-10]